MNLSYVTGYIVLFIHALFIISYMGYILYGQITQRYINIVFLVLIGLIISSVTLGDCFLTKIEQYLWDDDEWKGLSYTAYKEFLGVDNDLATMKYSFIVVLVLFYITFINRVRLHNNSISGKYFNMLMSI